MRRWNPGLHPRWPHNGQFRPKLSQSIRISPFSASYNVGVRVPVVPGRVNLYVGALARVENASGQRAIQKAVDKTVDRVLGRWSKGPAGQVLKGRDLSIGKARVSRSRIINPPTVRVSNRAPERHYAPGGKTYTTRAPRVRAPRKPKALSRTGKRVR